ncbi:MAG: histidine phosphatase family protein [Pseudomonadota bacterium]
MAEITLIRHGQANTGAQDEASYDQLSALGHDQARWIAAHLAQSDRKYDRIAAGTLHRQQDTAGHIASALGLAVETDARLNELDYFGLASSLEARRNVPFPTDRETFIAHVPEVLAIWEAGEIDAGIESFADFQTRVRDALTDAEAKGGSTLYVTSGGVIGMALRVVLDLPTASYGHILLQNLNTSLHRFIKAGDRMVLDAYNAIPHLEAPERASARTHI